MKNFNESSGYESVRSPQSESVDETISRLSKSRFGHLVFDRFVKTTKYKISPELKEDIDNIIIEFSKLPEELQAQLLNEPFPQAVTLDDPRQERKLAELSRKISMVNANVSDSDMKYFIRYKSNGLIDAGISEDFIEEREALIASYKNLEEKISRFNDEWGKQLSILEEKDRLSREISFVSEEIARQKDIQKRAQKAFAKFEEWMGDVFSGKKSFDFETLRFLRKENRNKPSDKAGGGWYSWEEGTTAEENIYNVTKYEGNLKEGRARKIKSEERALDGMDNELPTISFELQTDNKGEAQLDQNSSESLKTSLQKIADGHKKDIEDRNVYIKKREDKLKANQEKLATL